MSRIKFQQQSPGRGLRKLQTGSLKKIIRVAVVILISLGVFLQRKDDWESIALSTTSSILSSSQHDTNAPDNTITGNHPTNTRKNGSKTSPIDSSSTAGKERPLDNTPTHNRVFDTDNDSHTDSHLNRNVSKKALPSFDNGGFVFFLHVPKTGGSTIRWTLEPSEVDHISYGFVPGNGVYTKDLPVIEQYLNSKPHERRNIKTKKKRKILFIEIHGRDCPNLIQLRDNLLRWKRIASTNQIPTFFFTIVRDPLSYTLSYFNFFHVQRNNKHFERVPPSESNLLRLSLYNPQCQFLSRGELSLRLSKKQKPTMEECQQVKHVLQETMDWVGTTEQMNVETLPLLSHLLNLVDSGVGFETQRVSKKDANNSISLNQLSPTAIGELEKMTLYDRQLFNEIQIEYPMDMFEDQKWKKLLTS